MNGTRSYMIVFNLIRVLKMGNVFLRSLVDKKNVLRSKIFSLFIVASLNCYKNQELYHVPLFETVTISPTPYPLFETSPIYNHFYGKEILLKN